MTETLDRLDFTAHVEAVGPYTMERPDRILAFAGMLTDAFDAGLQGDIVECGVWRGGMMMLAARLLLERGDTSRTLWLYDTYTGMTRPEEIDVKRSGVRALDKWQVIEASNADWCLAPADDVKANLYSTGYPRERIRFIEGDVVETLKTDRPESIAVMRLDTDWHASTKAEFEHLYPLLVPGGRFLVADYKDWRGARAATDEFFAGRESEITTEMVARQLHGVKLP